MTTKEKQRMYQRRWYAKNKAKKVLASNSNPETNDITKIVEAYKLLVNSTRDEDVKNNLKNCFVEIISN